MISVAAIRMQQFGVQFYQASLTASVAHGVTVAYARANREQADTVAAAFPGATLAIDDSAGEVIRVSLGTGSPNVAEVSNRVGSTPLPTHTLTAKRSPTPSSGVTIKARSANTDACA